MIIAKFGGTSVSTPQSIQAICSIIKKEKKRQPVIVVSALCTITDTLLALIHCTESERQKYFTIIEKTHQALCTQVLPLKKQKIVQRYIDDCIQEMQNILAENIQTKAQEDIMLSYGDSVYQQNKSLRQNLLLPIILLDQQNFCKQ